MRLLVLVVLGRAHTRRVPPPTMEKHRLLPVDARHFDRWIELFEETARETCPPAAATHFVGRAAYP